MDDLHFSRRVVADFINGDFVTRNRYFFYMKVKQN